MEFDSSLLDQFVYCTSIVINLKDNLPRICLLCKADLVISYKFVERAKLTDAKLKNSSKGLIQIKDEDANDIFSEVKPEFVNCKDPLEDSDCEVSKKSSLLPFIVLPLGKFPIRHRGSYESIRWRQSNGL